VTAERCPQAIARQLMALGRGHGVPRLERARAQLPLVAGTQPLAAHSEEVTHDGVHREEALGLCPDLKPRMARSRCRVGWWEAAARVFA
jgi:hypothetical protein